MWVHGISSRINIKNVKSNTRRQDFLYFMFMRPAITTAAGHP